MLKSFFDKFNFKNNLLLKLGCKIAIFLNLTTLFEKLQKIFWCNFCDSTSISFIVISFHQIPLTWWNVYQSVEDYIVFLLTTRKLTHCLWVFVFQFSGLSIFQSRQENLVVDTEKTYFSLFPIGLTHWDFLILIPRLILTRFL